MPAEKLSISLPADLSRFIEQYRTDHALKNRSQVIGEALKLLRQRDLEAAYREMAQDEAAEVEALEWSEALVGTLSGQDMQAVERAVCVQLGLRG